MCRLAAKHSIWHKAGGPGLWHFTKRLRGGGRAAVPGYAGDDPGWFWMVWGGFGGMWDGRGQCGGTAGVFPRPGRPPGVCLPFCRSPAAGIFCPQYRGLSCPGDTNRVPSPRSLFPRAGPRPGVSKSSGPGATAFRPICGGGAVYSSHHSGRGGVPPRRYIVPASSGRRQIAFRSGGLMFRPASVPGAERRRTLAAARGVFPLPCCRPPPGRGHTPPSFSGKPAVSGPSPPHAPVREKEASV